MKPDGAIACAVAILACQFALACPAIAQDVAEGERLFGRCAACHAVGDRARHRTGPQLNGVVGRVVGSAEGFRYSKAFVRLKDEGQVWTEAMLDEYLARPAEAIRGTRMTFAGLSKAQDRANVIAYLKSLQPTQIVRGAE